MAEIEPETPQFGAVFSTLRFVEVLIEAGVEHFLIEQFDSQNITLHM